VPIVPAADFPFCGPSYLAASPVIDCQRSINLYPEPGLASSKTQMALIGRPGLGTTFVTLPNSPVRGIWAGNNTFFAAGGTHFFDLASNGTIATDYGTMASSTGKGPVQIIANGTQLLVMDSSCQTIFNADPVGIVMTSVFTGPALEYLDGFYVAIASGGSLAGSNPNQINVSNNGDGTTWNALAYVIRTGVSDLTTQLATLNGLLWIFGSKATEIWYDAGTAVFPFARVSGGTLNIGLLAPYSVVKFYNTIIWIGSDDRGYAQVYMANGMTPVRVSNFAVEQYLAMTALGNLPLTYAYGYQEAGHTFYCIKIVNSSQQPILEIVYDLTTGLWHERYYSAGIWPSCFASLPGNFYGSFNTNGPFFVGDAFSGKILFQSTLYPNDGNNTSNTITYTRTAPHISNENKVVKYPRFELDCDIGTAHPILDYSNNGGQSFLGYNRPLVQAADEGIPGAFPRFYATELGRSRDRVFKLTIADGTNLIRIANAYVTVEPGTEK
jgi:hypothetical protein